MRIAGIHHITAIAGDPTRNVAFYTEVLGLRMVKRTVNFDDPGSYHLYFGDEIGTPGTIITFFLWPGATRGTHGSAEVTRVSFSIPKGSMDFWKERLRENGIDAEEIEAGFGESGLRFVDPDGLFLQLVISRLGPDSGNKESASAGGGTSIPIEHKIGGFAEPTLEVSGVELTEKLLTEMLGFHFVDENGHRRRFAGSGNPPGAVVDVCSSEKTRGRIAVGSVHHIAFRCTDESEQLRWRDQLIEAGFTVSPVMDRNYFHSIYFREPNGILFEIATDGPGFTIDESPAALGQSLKLPPVFEPMRVEIERVLPPLEVGLPG